MAVTRRRRSALAVAPPRARAESGPPPVPLALAVIFAMLFLMFGNLRYAVAVFVNVPLALPQRRDGAARRAESTTE